MSVVARSKKLIEMMYLRSILLEGRLDFLRANFLPRIEQALATAPLHIVSTLPYDKDASEAQRFFDYVVSVDPDPVKSNTQWLLTQILRKNNPMPLEDLEGAKDTLTDFMEMKKTRQLPPEHMDINKFRSLSDLRAALRKTETAIVASSDQEEKDALAQSRIYYNGRDYLILTPLTQESACFWGRPTEWCTAWGHAKGRHPTRSNHYLTYANKGPLYVVIDKATGERWQFHVQSDQYMNVNDQRIDTTKFFQAHPKVASIFERMDGEPIGHIAEYPVYAMGKGFVVKSGKGLLGRALLTVNVEDDTKHFISYSANNRQNIEQYEGEIANMLNHLHILGNEEEGPEIGDLFYRNGKWGTVAEVGETIKRFADGYHWKQTKTSRYRYVDLINPRGKEVLNATVEHKKVSIYKPLVTSISPYSRYICAWLLTDHGIEGWDHETQIRPFMLDEADVKALVTKKPGLGDIPSAYKLHKASKAVKDMVMQWCYDNDVPCEAEWFGDALITKKYKDIAELVDDLGEGSAKWFLQIIEGDTSLDYPEATAEQYQKEEFIKSLDKDDLKKLGKWLQKTYPSDAEDIEDYDPTNVRDVNELAEQVDDDDLQRIADWAVSTGQEVGAEGEAYHMFERAIQGNRYIYFRTKDGYDSDMNWDVPVVFAVPLIDIVHLIEKDRDIASSISYSGWADHLEDAKIDIEEPYNGFTDYDDEAAQERFAELLHDEFDEDDGED